MTQTKVCTKCGEEKGLEGFHKKKSGKFGVRADCKVCCSGYYKQYRQENKERLLESNKQYRQENKEKLQELKEQYFQKNRERILEYHRQYYKQHRREYHRQYSKQYRQENREKKLAYKAKRRARKLKATPDWLTPIDYLVMQHIYETRPEDHHVDHIVPLRGKTVCGLHVPWNLQHLTAEENISKSNRVWPDMWEEA